MSEFVCWLLVVTGLIVVWKLWNWWRGLLWVDGLHRKAVIVTGCDSGFGNGLAKSLYAKGVYVYAACLTKTAADQLKNETGERLQTLLLDISKVDSIIAARDYVQQTLPDGIEFWGVVNNAGIAGSACPIEMVTSEDLNNVMTVNLYGMVEMNNAFLPMVKRSRGRLVNMASATAECTFPGIIPYCASKHAVWGYSESLRLEKAMWGIKVCLIEPGFFNTNITSVDAYANQFKQKWSSVDPEIMRQYGKDYVTKSVKRIGSFLKFFTQIGLGPVINAYENALFSKHPSNVYYPGVVAKLIHYQPQFVTDFIMSKMIVTPEVLDKKVASPL